jgi:tetratricopeptide (TPR) repeat protein
MSGDRLAWLNRLALGGLAAACLAFWSNSQSSFLLPKALAWHLAVAAGLALLLADVTRKPRGLAPALARSVLPLVLMTGLLALRYPWMEPTRSLLWEPFLWSGLAGTVLVVGGATIARPERRSLTVAFVAAGGIAAAVALLQYAGLDPTGLARPGLVLSDPGWVGPGRTPVSLLGNPSYLGEFLAGLLPLGVATVAQETPRRRWPIGLALTAMGAALLLAGARGPILGAVAGLAFVGIRLAVAARRNASRQPMRWRLAAGILLIAAALGWPLGLWGRFLSSWDIGSGSVGARLHWWRTTLTLVVEHPWLGAGPGRFRLAFAEAQASWLAAAERIADRQWSGTEQFLTAPHNELLHVLAEAGLVGLALLAWGLAGAVRAGLRAPAEAEGRPTTGEAAVAGLLALGVSALFGFPLHTASGLCLAGVLAGLALGAAPAEPRPAGGRTAALLLGVVLVAVLGNALLLGRAFAASRIAHRAFSAAVRGEHATAADLFDAAHAIDPLEPDIRYNRGIALARLGRAAEAIADLEAALGGLPAPRGYRSLADLHLRRGDPRAAAATLVRGLRLFPGHVGLATDYVGFLARRERYAEALGVAEGILRVFPNSPDGHHLRGHLLVRLGRPAEAAASLRRFLAVAETTDPRRAMDGALLEELRARGEAP